MIVLATSPDEQALPAKGAENVNERAAALLPELLAARQRIGLERYGRPLETFNGRDVHRDLLEELLDALQYAVQAQMERTDLEAERDRWKAEAMAARELHAHLAACFEKWDDPLDAYEDWSTSKLWHAYAAARAIWPGGERE